MDIESNINGLGILTDEKGYWHESAQKLKAEIIAYVRDLEARQFRWIPVSEGLPVLSENLLGINVFTKHKSGTVRTSLFDRFGKFNNHYALRDNDIVTHYAYIPELEELK